MSRITRKVASNVAKSRLRTPKFSTISASPLDFCGSNALCRSSECNQSTSFLGLCKSWVKNKTVSSGLGLVTGLAAGYYLWNDVTVADSRNFEISLPLAVSTAHTPTNITPEPISSRPLQRMDPQEFSVLMGALGITDENLVRNFFNYFDEKSAGSVDPTQVASALTSPCLQSQASLIFNVCDLAGNGKITVSELTTVVALLIRADARWQAEIFGYADDATFAKLTDVLVQDVFKLADVGQKGSLSLKEFTQFFKHIPTDPSAQALADLFDRFSAKAVAVLL